MRILKFRAWDKQDKRWVCNVYEDEPFEIYLNGDYLGLAGSANDWQGSERYELSQFTGLHDKNGKEIYEGDIVVQDCYLWFDDGGPNYRGTVEWIFSAWQVVAHCINPQKRGISDGANEHLSDEGEDEGSRSAWEVIGNIYENPDLLK